MIQHLRLFQYRNYSTSEWSNFGRFNVIYGPNGVGKTNLLDAIYFICYTKSYFSHHTKQCIQFNQEACRVDCLCVNYRGDDQKVAIVLRPDRKQYIVNGETITRLTDFIGWQHAVFIGPDDIETINGPGEMRRKWLDTVLSQSNHSYFDAIVRFQKVLQQRNALLKTLKHGGGSLKMLDYYDQQMVVCSHIIFETRKTFVDAQSERLAKLYAQIAGETEYISWVYQSRLLDSPIDELLNNNRRLDIESGRTTEGIHRDDIDFNLNSHLFRTYASQGQKKSLLFAIKILQYQFVVETTGTKPFLLLDDVFEKLDQNRVSALMQLITSDDFGQVFITDTDKERVVRAFKNEDFDIRYFPLGII